MSNGARRALDPSPLRGEAARSEPLSALAGAGDSARQPAPAPAKGSPDLRPDGSGEGSGGCRVLRAETTSRRGMRRGKK
ncbi:Hypothetical predicted protein [Podarcis lilfordi]|uniref:Uncharacterized protein n=1 Tax=Podarcis lilfordi TaxID=74358 RepID=A0AA35KEN6_9SAUR|nr:Hypothetical predicted protein [Podarcis lilfordi]